MNLKTIYENADKAIYTVEGEVDDVSGGESGKDYSLDVTYTVTSDTLVQEVESETMMDNNFEELELIKMPLDRKSTRLNSSHVAISYAVFCLKKKITAHDNEGE